MPVGALTEARLLVVGTGLVGTSVGLALGGEGVLLSDPDATALRTAVERGAGQALHGRPRAALGLLAVPPAAVAGVFRERHAQADAWIHVASVQAGIETAVGRSGAPAERLCGTHPLAGKESAGPSAASADLFDGRPWALCPSPRTAPDVVELARRLALDCGAVPTVLTAAEHDAAVALASHLPQVAASALAAVLAAAAHETGPLELAGPGLQDSTRIAASDPALWTQILSENAGAVGPLVRALAAELAAAADQLDRGDGLQDLLERGNAGRALVPVKRQSTDVDFALVRVRVADRTGRLAALFVAAAEAGIDVEDVRLEHLPGRASGVIEVSVAASQQQRAATRLAAAGWDVLT